MAKNFKVLKKLLKDKDDKGKQEKKSDEVKENQVEKQEKQVEQPFTIDISKYAPSHVVEE